MLAKKMSLTLTLPPSFIAPEDYLRSTPEENAAILILGVSLLGRLRSEDYTARMDELKRRLKDESDANAKVQQTLTSLNQFMSAKVDDAVERSFATITEKVEALARNMVAGDKIDREANLAAVSGEREGVDRRVGDIKQLLDRISELSGKIDVSRLVSSAKGRSNEESSQRLIIDTFSTPGSGFVLHRRENFAGDHIFDWNGLRIMWEDKNYTSIVPKQEVEKGLRDFGANADCHVLIFVSANTPITGYETSTGIVSEVRAGRLMIFISYFKNNIDPVGYIRTVIQTILSGLRPLLLEQSEDIATVDNEKMRMLCEVLGTLSQSLHEQEKAFDGLLSDLKVRIMSMKNGLTRTKHGIDKIMKDIVTTQPVDEAHSAGSSGSAEQKRVRKCGNCSEYGHDRRQCPRGRQG